MDPSRPKGPHAPEFVLASMRAMGQGTMASRVGNLANIFYDSIGISLPKKNLPSEKTQRNWRYGMHYICMVQVGEVLTRAVRNGDTKLIITSDGSPVNTYHTYESMSCTCPTHAHVHSHTLPLTHTHTHSHTNMHIPFT